MAAEHKISSFAVLDLETTGLPHFNFNKTSITELCIHAFAADDARNATKCVSPRVNHKLTMAFNPLRRFDLGVEEITGLDNYILEEESPFNQNAAEAIISFLKHLRQPVCLISHNGNRFDFPVFKASFNKLNVELPSNLLCVDSLDYVKYFDVEKAEEIPSSQEEHLLTEKDENLPPTTTSDTKIIEEQPLDRQKRLETTPKRRPSTDPRQKIQRKQMRNEEKTTALDKKVSSRRSLFPTDRNDGYLKNPPQSYTLGAVYKRLFNRIPDTAHNAEADVVVLKEIILHHGKTFVDYAEANAKPFESVKELGKS